MRGEVHPPRKVPKTDPAKQRHASSSKASGDSDESALKMGNVMLQLMCKTNLAIWAQCVTQREPKGCLN